MATNDDTKMRRQYRQIKAQNPDAILLFRMGDFYEVFCEDAITVSRELNVALTTRDKKSSDPWEMAGIPYHALDKYLPRLIERGYKVAICEQMTEPGKGLVEREVIRVVTPGTIIEPHMLQPKRNNYLAALWLDEKLKSAALAYTDITTGEFYCTQFVERDLDELQLVLRQELGRLAPAEMLVPKKTERRIRPELLFAQEDENEDPLRPYRELFTTPELMPTLTPHNSTQWNEEVARHALLDHFEVASLEGFGLVELPLAVRVAGAMVAYIKEMQKGFLSQLCSPVTYTTKNYMALDQQTRRNLELLESGRSGSKKHSLYGVLDQTRTSMGGRMLHRWLNQPLLDLKELQPRQDAVAAFYAETSLRDGMVALLREVQDIERLTARASQRVASPQELFALRFSLEQVPTIRTLLEDASDSAQVFANQLAELDPCSDISELIASALVDEPPNKLGKGNADNPVYAIRPGFSADLDRLKSSTREAKEWIAELTKTEQARTGINNLKVGFNLVFGYYIEITSTNLSRVPKDYIRKQTLANGERYITPELKEKENIVLTASEKIERLERELFRGILEKIRESRARLLATATALAELDVFCSLAEVAVEHSYCRPTLNNGPAIKLSGGRHPVVEAANREHIFVPNDTCLSSQQEQILVITGPNMAGKSTFLRQAALIVLMAQIGAFVPADSATIGLVDRIFTRVGAQDDIATGQSTFMVEMTETSYILSHATPRSLIILDEVGRGTSTYDGLAIAQAVIEYIHNNPKCGAKTLFATHYHELIELANVLPRVRNFNVAVTEEGNKVLFLRKVVPGGADRSYGIHVAQLAGLPRSLIHRAEELLLKLEGEEPELRPRKRRNGQARATLNGNDHQQMNLFASTPVALQTEEDPALVELRQLNVAELSPMEAINKLYELQQKINNF
ncbi:MAG: DNA mismatch repair protein MutS [Chloroflexota bacterium]|nr:DNA mismatch repair protein MutS [Chloroflexota bacterium]